MLIEITTVYDREQDRFVLEKPCPFGVISHNEEVAKANGAWCTLKCGYKVGYDSKTKTMKCDYDGEFGTKQNPFKISIWGRQ